MAPVQTCLVSDSNYIAQRLVDCYAERAAGKAGAVVAEATLNSTYKPNRLRIADDWFVHRLERLASTIHEAGAKAFIQIEPGSARFEKVEPAFASILFTREFIQAFPVAPRPEQLW